METLTPETDSPKPSSQQRRSELSPPLWKRILPFVFVPPVLLLVWAIVQSPWSTGGTPEVVVGGRTRVIQLDVLNGAGQPKLAQRVTDYLRARGFDVVEMGNYSTNDVEATMVLDRAGNLDAAKQVASALGVSEEQVHQKIDRSLYLDVSVILGKDYARLKVFH
jgi:hypothetical protein